MKLKNTYERLYKNMKSGKYDIAVADENTFKMKTSISFIDLLKDCDKEGVNIENFLRYAKEQEECSCYRLGESTNSGMRCSNCGREL